MHDYQKRKKRMLYRRFMFCSSTYNVSGLAFGKSQSVPSDVTLSGNSASINLHIDGSASQAMGPNIKPRPASAPPQHTETKHSPPLQSQTACSPHNDSSNRTTVSNQSRNQKTAPLVGSTVATSATSVDGPTSSSAAFSATDDRSAGPQRSKAFISNGNSSVDNAGKESNDANETASCPIQFKITQHESEGPGDIPLTKAPQNSVSDTVEGLYIPPKEPTNIHDVIQTVMKLAKERNNGSSPDTPASSLLPAEKDKSDAAKQFRSFSPSSKAKAMSLDRGLSLSRAGDRQYFDTSEGSPTPKNTLANFEDKTICSLLPTPLILVSAATPEKKLPGKGKEGDSVNADEMVCKSTVMSDKTHSDLNQGGTEKKEDEKEGEIPSISTPEQQINDEEKNMSDDQEKTDNNVDEKLQKSDNRLILPPGQKSQPPISETNCCPLCNSLSQEEDKKIDESLETAVCPLCSSSFSQQEEAYVDDNWSHPLASLPSQQNSMSDETRMSPAASVCSNLNCSSCAFSNHEGAGGTGHEDGDDSDQGSSCSCCEATCDKEECSLCSSSVSGSEEIGDPMTDLDVDEDPVPTVLKRTADGSGFISDHKDERKTSCTDIKRDYLVKAKVSPQPMEQKSSRVSKKIAPGIVVNEGRSSSPTVKEVTSKTPRKPTKSGNRGKVKVHKSSSAGDVPQHKITWSTHRS